MVKYLFKHERDAVEVPGWVQDWESFRRWADEDGFPERGRISFIDGEIEVDLDMEQIFTHVAVKHEVSRVLGNLAVSDDLGRFYADGTFVSHEAANVSNQPDGCFVLAASLQSGRMTIRPGRDGGFVELIGSADMMFEIVSPGSVKKDTVKLRERYAVAGVSEYWLIDARKPPLSFDLLKLGKNGYVASRKAHGWSYSRVFARWFRLTQSEGRDGYPVFRLEVSEEKPKQAD